MVTITVKAKHIVTGDFLPGLDNGYVFEDPETNHGLMTGRYNQSFGPDCILIGFHTAEGDEAHLLCPPNMPVTISTDAPNGRDAEDFRTDDDDDDDDEGDWS